MKLEIDLKSCLRTGRCYFDHPALFAEGDDGFPRVLKEAEGDEEIEAARDAAESCPTQAILIDRDNPSS